jgi:hypothetical protein
MVKGMALLDLGHYTNASHYLDQALKERPNDTIALVDKGLAL